MARVVIIDYGMGNLRSVANAFGTLAAEVEVASTPASLRAASHVVLPGVGAFGDGARNLRQSGWIEPLTEVVQEGRRPFLGICLGMQLLATVGTEHGRWEGLGWFRGSVDRLETGERPLHIPHIGWNDLQPAPKARLFAGLGERPCFYFLHSYAIKPEDPAVVAARCEYGAPFVAALERDNVFGVQFHPEKSHRLGLSLLKNFLQC
jgi:imidazole glycerol-phosphate synthase subunit HisH